MFLEEMEICYFTQRHQGPPNLERVQEDNFPIHLFDSYFSVELVCWKCSENSDKSQKSHKSDF